MNIFKKTVSSLWSGVRGIGIIATLGYCLLVFIYILCGREHPDFFHSSAFERIGSVLISLLFAVFAASGYRYISQKFGEKIRTGVLVLMMLSVAAFMNFYIPYCPANDCYDLTFFLQMALENSYSKHATAYLAGYVTNRLVVLLYFPAVKIFGNIQTGVMVSNFIFSAGSMLFIFGACRRIFGKTVSEASAFVLTAFFPFMLLVGPYIYLPAIFFASAALFFYSGKKLYEKIIAFIIGGILFAIRPVACGFFLVYIAVDGLLTEYKRFMILKNIGKTIAALICFVLINNLIGYTLYATKIHPYPKLDSLATLWTIEVGTRPKGMSTGVCTYAPFDDREVDEIGDKFHEIWDLYSYGDSEKYEEIVALKDETMSMIKERIGDTILSSPASMAEYLEAKFANYYKDAYKPYYFSANLTSPYFGKGMYMNYNQRYFLFMNTFIMSFSLIAVIIMIIAFIKLVRKNVSHTLCNAAVLALGAILVSIAAIMLTEVGKRLIFDVTVPMLAVISYGVAAIVNYSSDKVKGKAKTAFPICAVLAFVLMNVSYNQYNLDLFKDCRIDITETEITFNFSAPAENGYMLITTGGEEIPLGGLDKITVPNGENRGDFIYVRTPDGREYGLDKVKPAK